VEGLIVIKRLIALAALTLVGCTSPVERVTKIWTEGGHASTEFTDVGEKIRGGKCAAGSVAGMAATICEFGSAEEAGKAQEEGWTLLGGAVGSSVAAGKVLLVIADAKKEDPSGRRLNELINSFRKNMR
jgi:hypothetical protein